MYRILRKQSVITLLTFCLFACGRESSAPPTIAASPSTTSPAKSATARNVMNAQDAPTLITLQVKDTPLEKVLPELSRQAGIPVRLYLVRLEPNYSPSGFHSLDSIVPDPDPPNITLNAIQQPFWLVIREICRQTRLSPVRTQTFEHVTLQYHSGFGGTPFFDRPFVNHGCFLVTLLQASHDSVWFQVYVDPKLKILDCPRPPEITAAVDEHGNSLLLPPLVNYHSRLTSSEGGWFWSFFTCLKSNPKESSQLAEFRGTVDFTAAAESQHVEISDPLEAPRSEVPINGTQITFVFPKYVPLNPPPNIDLELIAFGRNGEKRWHPAFKFYEIQESTHLLDPAGEPLGHYTGHDGGGDEIDNHFYLTFQPTAHKGPPSKLIVDLPTKVRQVTLPLEFKNVQLQSAKHPTR